MEVASEPKNFEILHIPVQDNYRQQIMNTILVTVANLVTILIKLVLLTHKWTKFYTWTQGGFFYIFYNPFRNNTPSALFILRCEVKNYIQVRILYK